MELKEKFFAELVKRNDKSGYWEYTLPPEKIWQFIEANTVPKSEYDKVVTFSNDMVSGVLKQSEQIAELKAENEKLSADGIKLGYFIFKDACGEQVRKEVYDNYTGFKQVLPIEIDKITEKARTDERAGTLDECLGIVESNCFQVDAKEAIEKLIKAITADQEVKI